MATEAEPADPEHVEIGVERLEGGVIALTVAGTVYHLARDDAKRLGDLLHRAAGSAFHRTGQAGRPN